jgi:ABC-type transport system involved in cytochrome c biogenesis permease subunit
MSAVNLSIVCYLAACVLYLICAVFRRSFAGRIASATLTLGLISNGTAVILRWHNAGHPPLSNMHESLIFIAFCIAATALIVELRYGLKIIAAFAALMSLLALGYASLLDATIAPLMPALKSNWLIIHVMTYFIAYGAATIAAIAAVAYLIMKWMHSPNEEIAGRLDSISYRLILFAFPFLTVGLTTGAVWANIAWGRYWGWDPKETWSLVTWFVYALYLHARTMRGWKGGCTAIIAVAGFVFIVFTFLGVNFLMSGLHSYAGS